MDKQKQLIQQLHDLDQELASITYIESLLGYDSITSAPQNGVETRSKVSKYVATLYFNTLVQAKTEELLHELANYEHTLDMVTLSKYKFFKREYNKIKVIPQDEYTTYQALLVQSSNAWEDAKENNDFSIFAPYLSQVIHMTKKFIDYRGYEGHPYNTLLHDFEPDITVEMLDHFFETLKKTLIPFIQKIQQQAQPDTSFLTKKTSLYQQELFSLYIAEALKFNLDSGILAESEHPFTENLSPDDVRITTHYFENDLMNPIFSTIHETGHGLYEQNISKDLGFSCLATGVSTGIHESQSRLYENNFGRSYSFWKKHYPVLQSMFPDVLRSVTLQQFMPAINKVEPSLIRVNADEVTYPLHVMVRYELEKEIFEGDVDVNTLPKRWADKYEAYIGVRPTTDTEGILQDVHWSEGLFGYFPSYALGSAYATQFEYAMKKEISIEHCLETGDMTTILNWLSIHIHQYGSVKTPAQLLQDVTGEHFNPQYFVDAIIKKYSDLYHL